MSDLMGMACGAMVELMKEAAIGAMGSTNPFSFSLGLVLSANPLKVLVDQKLTLGEQQLILTNAVRDYYVKLTTCGESEGQADGTAHKTEKTIRLPTAPEDYGAFDNHDHEYKGNKWFKVNLALKANETVLLIRLDGGQKYIILDRLEAPKNG